MHFVLFYVTILLSSASCVIIVNEVPVADNIANKIDNEYVENKGALNNNEIQGLISNLDEKHTNGKLVQVIKVPSVYEVHVDSNDKLESPQTLQQSDYNTNIMGPYQMYYEDSRLPQAPSPPPQFRPKYFKSMNNYRPKQYSNSPRKKNYKQSSGMYQSRGQFTLNAPNALHVISPPSQSPNYIENNNLYGSEYTKPNILIDSRVLHNNPEPFSIVPYQHNYYGGNPSNGVSMEDYIALSRMLNDMIRRQVEEDRRPHYHQPRYLRNRNQANRRNDNMDYVLIVTEREYT